MKRLLFNFIFLFSSAAFATPEHVELIFLSEPKTSSFLQKPWTFLGRYVEANWKDNCVPTGDGCFHPQLGYVSGDGPKPVHKEQAVQPPKTFNSSDIDLVDCREGEYFDIFCGKAKKEEVIKSDVEIWIDTSASLRKMDFSTDPSRCVRRSFVEGIQKECGHSKVYVQTYDTSIKKMGSLEGLCQHYGSNDVSRLIKWIKASNAKYLMIVTDIDELSSELRDFLDSIGAVYHGGDVKDITVKDLDSYIGIVKKHCK